GLDLLQIIDILDQPTSLRLDQFALEFRTKGASPLPAFSIQRRHQRAKPIRLERLQLLDNEPLPRKVERRRSHEKFPELRRTGVWPFDSRRQDSFVHVLNRREPFSNRL